MLLPVVFYLRGINPRKQKIYLPINLLTQVSLLDLSNHPGRVACHDRVRRHTAGDDCPGAHHSIAANPHPRQENSPAPNPNIVLDHDRFGYFQSQVPGLRLKLMGRGIDLDVRPDHDMIANIHLIAIQDGAQDIQIDMIADRYILTIDTKEGWLNDRILTDVS